MGSRTEQLGVTIPAQLANYIGGELRAPASGAMLDNVQPATGQLLCSLPDSGAEDLSAALAAAEAALPGWQHMLVEQRAQMLARVASIIERDAEAFAHAESADTGKPLSLARTVDVPRAVANLRFFAAAVTQFHSESHAMAAGAINYTLRQPLGVVACISPWNLPLYLLTWKIAPALAAGNCVLAKPSELSPITAHMLSEACIEAGLPAGVLNMLHGRGAGIGQALVEAPAIRAISFTGGTETGRRIAATAAPRFARLALELGGKNPTLIFADADLDQAVDTALTAAFRNQGEICLCGSRILIERPVYEQVRDRLVAGAKALRVGDPLEENTDQGALIGEHHMRKVLGAIEQAQSDGGRVLCGGERVQPAGRCEAGYFVAPTLIEGLGPECALNQDEIFGPVASLMPFDSEEEALAIANGTPFGLAASVFSKDISRCHRLAARLQSGLVWINTWMLRDLRTPMGGMKQSGVGREGGVEAMRFFTEPTNVCIKY